MPDVTALKTHHVPDASEIVAVAELPDGLAAAREGLHRLAAYVIAPARHRVTGRFGLRWTAGGVGTPEFGDGRQVRIDGDQLVVVDGGRARTAPITTLEAAVEHLGEPIDPDTAAEEDSPPVGDTAEDLAVTADHVEWLANWWGIGVAALETVRADDTSIDGGEVQIWPGHFDGGVEIGDEDRRASFGVSPGDAASPEPYLYVSVWWPDRLALDAGDSYWTAEGYVGAARPASALVGAADPVAEAVRFFRSGRDRLRAAALIQG